MELETIPFDLRHLADEVARTLRPLARDKRLELTTEVDPAVPPAVAGDPGRLRQVLNNLLSNALKFTEQGGVTLRLSARDEGEARVRVRIQVDDTGIGVPQELQSRLFRVVLAGGRLHHAPLRRHRARARHLEAAGGADGRRHRLRRPRAAGQLLLVRGPAGAGQRARRPRHTGALGRAGAASGAREPARVLVVEDNPVNQRLAVRVLERLGYRTETADHGRDALAALERRQFDAILMDCQMPVMDGYEATARIREREGGSRHTPIIAVTAGAMDQDRERCLRAGMDEYVAKPFGPDEIAAVLRRFVAGAPGSVADAGAAASAAPDFARGKLDEVIVRELLAFTSPEFVRELIELFVRNTRVEIVAMRKAQQDPERLRAIAHKLKGSCFTIGAHALAALCERVESLASGGAARDLEPVLQELETEFAETSRTLGVAPPDDAAACG